MNYSELSLDKLKEIAKEKGITVGNTGREKLIEKIEKYLSLPYETRREMGTNGRNKVAKEFSRQIIIDRYLKVLGEINERKQAN